MKIIVDAMGGDNAPVEIVRGALNAARARQDLEIVLVGREEDVRSAIGQCGGAPGNVSVVNATEVIDMHDDPATAFKVKKDSSITVGLTMLKNGEGDAFVSAGSTGALLSAGTLLVKRVRGIRRAAMAPVIPTAGGHAVLIDCGANAECTVEYLMQFAYLGSFYASRVLGLKSPRVGLLNNGTEETKGPQLQREAYALLTQAGQAGILHFVGNTEAREVPLGQVDVIVCDGYAGNVLLKSIEGTAMFMGSMMKRMFQKNLLTKLGALCCKSGIDEMMAMLDYREVGGTALLGIRKPVIKAHGSSDPRAFRSASRRMASVRAKASISGAVLSPCRGWAGRVWGAEAGTEGAAGAGASAGVSGSGAAI